MKYIFANWKLYLGIEESKEFAEALVSGLPIIEKDALVIFPNALAFNEVQHILSVASIPVGAQNIAWVPKGAYTGALSAHLFREAGARYALVGHSERRHIFGEKDRDAQKKIEACFDANITPVLCIGETKEDVDEGKRQYRLKKQLMSALTGVDLSNKNFFVAYEPVWSISANSGLPCEPADVEDVHGWLREELKTYSSAHIPLLYGGSVEAQNVVSYLSLPTVDGVLVGSASTTRDSLVSLIHVAASL